LAQINGPQDSLSFVVASSGTTPAAGQALGNPGSVGIIVPTRSPASTVVIEVSDDNSTFFGLTDEAGAAVGVFASGTGAFAADITDRVKSHKFVRPKYGTAQTSGGTITLTRKVAKSDRL
jgi:hypothetical protein